ncbi:S66 peptidase family protein [Lacibacter sediminis]|uniref:LD-carboxypeptidase n=1 Tax=Lacibacter sediminis TaxID=2760713 RepID=A0A7G5XJG6_9BACT|nr:LD-carboxypeptidase [Lacibacter sediminis]QNA45619.1 LD-carboxypeptidase [Lacibacter sediminis]
MKTPSYLKKGDTIAITCPAGYMKLEKAQTCITVLQQWGYEVLVGKTLGSKSKTYFSGTDEERLNEFQAMLDAPEVKAILCGRGGYGVGRIIDQLDFTAFKKNPKWIIGFSDITIFHAHINRNFKIATLHSSMASAFNDGGYKNKYVQSIKAALGGKKANYSCKTHRLNQTGKATAELVGGNLALITHLIGTKSDYQTKGKILFIEDIGEQHYNIDRMLHQLKRSGKLNDLAGLIIGGFTDMQDTERPFGKKVYNIIHELINEYKYPVCFGFPVSHDKENLALKVGASYQLTVSKQTVQLKEQ